MACSKKEKSKRKAIVNSMTETQSEYQFLGINIGETQSVWAALSFIQIIWRNNNSSKIFNFIH